jgi:hypothetical protein
MQHHPVVPPSKSNSPALIEVNEALLNRLFSNPDEQHWALDVLQNQGSEQQRVLAALMLKRIGKLLTTIEVSHGVQFVLQQGEVLMNTEHTHREITSVPLPLHLGFEYNQKQIAASVSHAPLNEILLFTVSLQVIDWAIKIVAKD